jgi:DNA excision repair protein ERCC-4
MVDNFLWDKESPKPTTDIENPPSAVDNIASAIAMRGGNITSATRREGSSSVSKSLKMGLVFVAGVGAITLGVVFGLDRSSGKPVRMESTTSSASSTVQESALVATTESKPAAVANKQEYFTSSGPFDARVRAVSPSITNGYETCSDLENDIVEALKLYVNDYINEQAVSAEMYAQCDPDNDNWYWDLYDDDYYYNDGE